MNDKMDGKMDYEMEELLPVVSELAQKYAGCESTSVTYEKAQELMEAVLYCLNEYNSSCPDGLVHRDISVREQYRLGEELIFQKVGDIRKIFNELSLQFEDFGVKCLYETVQKGIPQFLRWYDIKFCPQNTLMALDYPLLTDCSSLRGADAVYEYIRGIRAEQMFLGAFDKEYVTLVLENYDAEYRDMVENICSIVLANTVGHIAVKKPFHGGGFLEEEYLQLSKVFGGKTVPGIEEAVKALIGEMVRQFYGNDADLLAYLCCDTGNIAARIDTAIQYGQLCKVFVL